MFKKVKDQKGIKLQQRKASLLVQVDKTLSPKRYKLSLVSLSTAMICALVQTQFHFRFGIIIAKQG